MFNEEIRNGIVGGLWLTAGGAIGHWFYRRRVEVRQILYGPDAEKLSESEADGHKMKLVAFAFAGAGVWVVLLGILNWLFGLF